MMTRASFLEQDTPSKRTDKSRTCLAAPKTRSSRTLVLSAAIAAAVFFVVYKRFFVTERLPLGLFRDQRSSLAATNATLGFGAILLLSLPERTDRRDGVSLIAATSGVQISHVIEAVKGDQISEKAYPPGRPELSMQYLGSWRTHMTALKYVVDHGLETALLLEDDVDWDVRIKSHMASLSAGFRDSPLRNHSSPPVDANHPYGLDWDILHMGNSWIKTADAPYDKIHVRYPDPDRQQHPGCPEDFEPQGSYCWGPLLEQLAVPAGHRALVPSFDSVGLTAVAVTQRGARRILFQMAWNRLETLTDWSVRNLLMRGDVEGWDVVPPLFGQYKIGGALDSDIDGRPEIQVPETPSWTLGSSMGIERSAKAALAETLSPAPDRPGRWSEQYWAQRAVAGQGAFV